MKRPGPKKLNTEARNKIMQAAREEFYHRGLHGARTAAIAERAGLSKGLLHFHFKTKESLFDTIFLETAQSIFPKINAILTSDMDLLLKAELFIDTYVDLLHADPYSVTFIFNEITTNPERSIPILINKPSSFYTIIKNQLAEGGRKNKFNKVSAEDLILTLFSLCVFPFIGIKLQGQRLHMTEEQYLAYILERKRFSKDLIKKVLIKK